VTAAAPVRLEWRLATVTSVRDETPHARTIVLEVPDWSGHRAGQHVDIRLVAEDGYEAQRSYSIASPPDGATVELTVERIANAADAAIHHVGRRHHVDAGLGFRQCLAHQRLECLVIQDHAVAQQAVMAMARIGVERHIADDADCGHRALDLADGAVHQVLRVPCFLAPWALPLERSGGKERDGRDAQSRRRADRVAQSVERKPLHAGH